jgi:hypothetical protein
MKYFCRALQRTRDRQPFSNRTCQHENSFSERCVVSEILQSDAYKKRKKPLRTTIARFVLSTVTHIRLQLYNMLYGI